MSNFFQNQIKAKKRTRLLIFLYFLAIIGIIFGIYTGLYLVLSPQNAEMASARIPYWNLDLFLPVAITVLVVIGIVSLFKILTLSAGGEKVALSLGGRLISPETVDPYEKRIINVVEEIAIASGVPVPPVYLLEEELGINAFAAGFTPKSAVVAVSKGCVELLSRDELQGVVAHEFSHILNGDMRLNIKLIGVLHGILFIAIAGRVLLRSGRYSRRSKDKGGGIAMIGLVLCVVGYTGVFFANLIKLAVSRQREYLADASAVQFTRQPEGISGALKKIGSLAYGSRINHSNAEEASHMYFSDGIRSSFSSLFSTHPDLTDRITQIDKSFDGVFPEVTYQEFQSKNNLVDKKPALDPIKNALDPILNPILNNPAGEVLGKNILGTVGTIAAVNLASSQSFLKELPVNIYDATHNAQKAPLIIYITLLDENQEVFKKQIDILKNKLSEDEFKQIIELNIVVKSLNESKLLPLLDLCLPALATLPQEKYKDIRELCKELAHADQRIDLLEYILHEVLLSHYNKVFYPEQSSKIVNKNMQDLAQPASNLFLSLSILGNPSSLEVAKASYFAAVEHTSLQDPYIYDFDNLPKVTLEILDSSIKEFKNVDYSIREIMLRACISCISYDNKVTPREFAIIRAIADNFDCPVPYLEIS